VKIHTPLNSSAQECDGVLDLSLSSHLIQYLCPEISTGALNNVVVSKSAVQKSADLEN